MSRAPSVLLVEDDAAIAEPLARALRREGYTVLLAPTAAEAALLLAEGTAPGASAPVDVVVLDRGLPDGDGLDVCRRAREAGSTVPVIVLTARAEEVELVLGLDAGADDYLTKPFRTPVLLARLRALLRRAPADDPSADREPETAGARSGGDRSPGDRSGGGARVAGTGVVGARGVRLDPASRRAWQGEEELRLSIKEFDLLRVLLRDAGSVVPRDAIMREVWGADWFGSTKTLDMHVSWLRRKLGDPISEARLISTVRGVGFRFERD